ncbi:uncharacterized protein EV420DRAFT_1313672 [Desarmillaria tabescens]|uniref:Integrase core domain-containing protein n=1 Tax=Armillaria tabescens TaxID=1929756 RepID=A0AA39JSG7_ARMTA|nr:uncharacterized protein EV420DRAFT_1313672 [Desarmillaria tabescens]KAK0447011.1 hypothetical protein EV420DRAFT_1313672 [Desarmillaria tabescens]
MSENHGLNTDPIHQFLIECHNISSQATFMVDSLPNAETTAVERVVHQLYAIRTILHSLDDHQMSDEDINQSRLWLDVRKDSLETYRQIFQYLEEMDLLDMDNLVHRVCLFLVFHPRIQASLDRTRDAWNHHQLRTEHYKTPIAIYELSREKAMRRGYWTGDPGDSTDEVRGNPYYGIDGDINDNYPFAPPEAGESAGEENEADVALNNDEEIEFVKELMGDFNFEAEDSNWGIEVYCEAVIKLSAMVEAHNTSIP